ncbi:hypothetical protein BGZ99_007471 [Dissophora globulifera]|uniref:MCMDC2 N-terminal domain-containing protein n=1 Tax=Dissophora globulifera TaxID=979702 RepID=A0A9P6RRZ9_9FUNG|nr:hypothetical protein BGZ99_007471 [Dissophora globulifera]
MAESMVNRLQTGATIGRYFIRFYIDPIDLLQCCSSLGNDYLNDPDSLSMDFHLVSCQILQQMLGKDGTLLVEQVRLRMRIKYLPSAFLEYSQTFKCNNPRCHNQNYLHYTPSAPWNRVIKRTEDDGFMETGTSAALLNIDLICSHCDLQMSESVLDRVFTKQQTITLECYYTPLVNGCFTNQISAVLKDDLTNTAVLGENIILLGTLSRGFPDKHLDYCSHGVQIEVNNIIRESPSDSPALANPILEIIQRNMSAWNTTQAMIDLLDAIAPRDVYRKLKLALLLSAVSIAEDSIESGHITAERNQIRPSVHVLFGILQKPSKTKSGDIKAHLLSAARNGIVMFELDHVDGGDIFIQRNDSIQALELICCCWSTHTRIASTAESLRITAEYANEDFMTGPARDVVMIDAFDIVVLQNEMDGASEVSHKIAAQTIRRCVADPCLNVGHRLPTEDLRQYVGLASRINVRLSAECEQLLKSYFQVMRTKGSGLDTNELSSIALCLRSAGTVEDALVSIMMVEETMAARFGTSRLGFAPLLDGKENITRLYSPSAILDPMPSQGRVDVPTLEHDLDCCMPVIGANVPITVEEERDHILRGMHEHLIRVIQENTV